MRNEMMYRPVVDERVLNFMRTGQKKLTGELAVVEAEARAAEVPIIPEETVVFMQFLLGQLRPKNILEIGCAIGFSASLMANYLAEDGHITTIDRFDVMIKKARKTFERLELEDKVTLLEGQASDILPTLAGSYDFIFMDSAKAKYIEFLPECLRLLRVSGVLMIDDIFQGGTVFEPAESIKRGSRKIHRRLVELLEVVNEVEGLTSTVIPLGDGVLLITKDQSEIALPPLRD